MKNCIVVTSGGFEGENKDKAFGSSPEKGIFVISHLSANHDEGDTRVWFHASKSTANRLIIYSSDTEKENSPDFYSVLLSDRKCLQFVFGKSVLSEIHVPWKIILHFLSLLDLSISFGLIPCLFG
jgi:hypothetical protein